MSTHVKFTNKTRGSFRRAGIRFPAKANGSIIKSLEELDLLTEAQATALQNEPRLLIEPCEAPEIADSDVEEGLSQMKSILEGGKPAPAPKAKPKKAKATKGAQTLEAAEAKHETAMTAARKIEDPVKRGAAQAKANAALAKAQQD